MLLHFGASAELNRLLVQSQAAGRPGVHDMAVDGAADFFHEFKVRIK